MCLIARTNLNFNPQAQSEDGVRRRPEDISIGVQLQINKIIDDNKLELERIQEAEAFKEIYFLCDKEAEPFLKERLIRKLGDDQGPLVIGIFIDDPDFVEDDKPTREEVKSMIRNNCCAMVITKPSLSRYPEIQLALSHTLILNTSYLMIKVWPLFRGWGFLEPLWNAFMSMSQSIPLPPLSLDSLEVGAHRGNRSLSARLRRESLQHKSRD